MPICTSCTHPTPYLYTVYESAYNLRLEQCAECHAFADPYVEHDTLTLLLDLILLKRDVYRHLLFNRGRGARKLRRSGPASEAGVSPQRGPGSVEQVLARSPGMVDHPEAWEPARERARWYLIARLGTALVILDAFIRWTHLSTCSRVGAPQGDISEWNTEAMAGFARIHVGCFVETVTFHVGIIIASYVVLQFLDRIRLPKPSTTNALQVSGIRKEFRYSHIPLTLLYSSLTKLFLLFLLAIWRPAPVEHGSPSEPTDSWMGQALSLLDEDRLDRGWIVRNVLGGMSAGFGLRVVLDCHPLLTTSVILVGWAVKTLVAGMISQWVGIGFNAYETAGEMWLAYSIP
ncbi:Arv1-like family-domain-containing protein [Fomitopsis serialis]|uniref:Arv1-like family-domain-containing protein n=1 Tax=Fomitopsis serialis TaxID=139415 RepID=UPI0020074A70|nr:Arv1-like family-domain-containing protein [Neoantrodia serialis]KAH9917847.1 Arv1-like family-domain-containing protein [Neoantrodia serialis]